MKKSNLEEAPKRIARIKPASRTMAPDERYDANIDHILRSAAAVFAEKSFGLASIRDIAARARISFPRIYYYLRNKEELLYLISRRAFEQLVSLAESRISETDDPEERLRLFIRSHLEYHMSNLAEMKVLVREADSLTGRYAADIMRLKREYSRICRRLLEGLRRASQQNPRSRAGANPYLAAVRCDELVLYLVRAGARLRTAQPHHGRMFPNDRRDSFRPLSRGGRATTKMLEGCSPFPVEFAQRYVRARIWRRETIPQAIAKAALERPDSIAVSGSTRSLTYSQLLAEAGSLAALLSSNGIARNDRVVVQLPNCVEFAALTIACLEIGAIPVMTLPAFRRAELEHLVSFSEAKAIAIAPEHRGFDHAALARELKDRLSLPKSIFSTVPADGCISMLRDSGSTRSIGSSAGDPFDVALFLLSGGTTGMPKLIPRTHADFLYNARESAAATGLTSESRILIALPVEHNFALACPGLLGALLAGARTVLSQSTKAAELANIIERERITHLPCVPTLAIALLEIPESSRAKLASLRVITVGGQRLQETTAHALKRAFPHIVVQQVLGMAEGLLCFTRLDEPEEIAFTTQGRPLSPADEIRIVNSYGTDVPIGTVGELWCRGPYTIRGYFRAPDRNRDAFTADGFYRTGDLVRLDPSGNLVVEGRIKDLINRGGEKISAEEIEAHLIAHPAVSAAAVVSMPDAILGEKACAYLCVRDGETFALSAIREWLTARGVAQFKWPERIEFVRELPLTNVGKVKKSELRREIAEKLAAERASNASGPAARQGN